MILYFSKVIPFFSISIIAGLIFYRFPFISSLFSIIVIIFGAIFAVSKNKRNAIYSLLFISSYGMLLKVLRAGIFYELDKYAVTGLSIFILAFCANDLYESSKKYGLFFFCLVPGMILGQFNYDYMSLYISGPLALAFSAILFSDINYELDLKKCLLAIFCPIIMLSTTLALHLLLNLNQLSFGFSAVAGKITSGGFGPNQVSAVLGLGMIICTVLFFFPKNKLSKLIFVSFWVFLTIQTALTFSRGGLYGGLIGTLIILFYNFDKKVIISLIIMIATLFSFISFISSQSNINKDEGGAILSRISRLTTTGRIKIMKEDLIVFKQNPIVGVGIGQSSYYHVKNIYGAIAGSHTFFTRLLAEHGLPGLICLFIMLNSIKNSLFFRGHFFFKINHFKSNVFSLFYHDA